MALSKEKTLPAPPLYYPPLAKAARQNDLKVLHKLIDLDLGFDVDEEDSNGQTALNHAAEEGNTEAVVALLLAGADRTVQDQFGETPLHNAAYKSQPGCVRCLLQLWDDVEQENEKRQSYVHMRALDGSTALHIAAQRSSRETVLEILKGGANVLTTMRYQDHSLRSFVRPTFQAIHGVAQNFFDTFRVIRLLQDWGANVNSPALDERYPLMFAVSFNNVNATKALLEASADVNVWDRSRQTALIVASITLHDDPVLEQPVGGASIALKEFRKRYSKGNGILILKLLLSVPCIKVNHFDNNMRTALHYAAECNSIRGVKLLLKRDADPAIRDRYGKLPADLTRNTDIKNLLKIFQRGVHVIAYTDRRHFKKLGNAVVGFCEKKTALIDDQEKSIFLQGAEHTNCLRVTIPKNSISSKESLSLHVTLTPSPVVLLVNFSHFQDRQDCRALVHMPQSIKRESAAIVERIGRGEISLLDGVSVDESKALVASSHPSDDEEMETVISPYITISSSRPTRFEKRAQVQIPHCVESVEENDQTFQICVKSQRLSSDGWLTEWDNLPDEDVECSATNVTIEIDEVLDAVGLVAVAKSTSQKPISEIIRKNVQLRILGSPQLKSNTEVYVICSTNAYNADQFQKVMTDRFGSKSMTNLKEWRRFPEEIVCSSTDIDVSMSARVPAWSFSPDKGLVESEILNSSDALHSVQFCLECKGELVKTSCLCHLTYGDRKKDLAFWTPEPMLSPERPEVEHDGDSSTATESAPAGNTTDRSEAIPTAAASTEEASDIEAHLETPMSKIKSVVDVARVVMRVCSDVWKEIGWALDYSTAEVKNFISSENSSNESKLFEVIEGWMNDKGKLATVGKLLDACDKVKRKGKVKAEIESKLSSN